MANSQNIDIVIKAIDEATSQIKKVQSSISELEKSVVSAGKKTSQSTKQMGGAFDGISGKIKGVLATIGAIEGTKAFLGLTSQVEQSKIAFETLLGSQEKAKQMLADIDEFAAKTPFEKMNLTPLVQQLIGMGFEANKALPMIQVLGDSMAALGRGQDDLNGVVLALGQIQTKGKLSAEELMQMAERGLPVYQILQDKLKLTSKEMENIGNNGIKSGTAINALMTGLNEKFGGSMAKQAQTLQGQWSNLMDNIKSSVGNAGQGINERVKGWIASVNSFFDANRPVIIGFIDLVTQVLGSVAESIGVVFGSAWDVFANVIVGITGQTSDSAANQIKSWQLVFMAIGNGVQGLALLISYVIRGVMGGVKMIANAAQAISDTVVGFIGGVIGNMVNVIIDSINIAIRGIDKLLVLAGQSATGWQIQSVKIADKAATFIKNSWTENADQIGSAWQEMSGGMESDTQRIVGNMVASMRKYKTDAVDTGKTQSDLGDRIKKSLEGMESGLSNIGKAQGSAKGAAKAHADELKKLKEQAEEAIKPIIDKIKSETSAIKDASDKIKEKTEEWKKFRQEGVKALSDVNNEIVKLKKEASDITVKINSDRDKSLADRSVEVQKDIKSTLEDIAKLNKDISQENSPDKQQELLNLQTQLKNLEQERDYIKSNAPAKILEEADAYSKLSKAQQISLDAEKEKAKQLEENDKKMQVAIEKKMILEAQANQKNIGDLQIISGMKDGMMTASLELEKGKRVEIHDAENIALANDIAAKQIAFQNEYNILSRELERKLGLHKNHLEGVKVEYDRFNKFLKDDTAKTASNMIVTLNEVNAKLRETISLRAEAGMASSGGSTGVSGKRAFGGPVSAGEPYLVGERGPEVVIPSSSGTVIPNNQIGGGNVSINVNMGGVSVRNEQDINSLTRTITDEITRKLQLYKLGIA